MSITAGIVHLLQYLCVILSFSNPNMLCMGPPMAIEPPMAIRTLLRAVEDAQMLYSVYNSREQERVSHPLSSESQSQND